jgi:hypothetical protein
MMKFIHRLQGDEEEGSLPQGNDNRSSAGYPPEPGKSKDQRKPSRESGIF